MGSVKAASVSPQPQPSASSTSSLDHDCSQRICSSYCYQWCNYFILPPPPPDDGFSSPSSSSKISPLMVALISVLAAAFLLLTYYTCSSTYCKHRRRPRRRRAIDDDSFEEFEGEGFHLDDQRRRLNQLVHGAPTNSQPAPSSAGGLEDRFIKSITVFKYRRGDGLVDSSECAVCLTEFKEEESLRLMPNCQHAFHLPCIDTWLKSHSSCPICRAPMVLDPTMTLPASRPPPTSSTAVTTSTVSRHQNSRGSQVESVMIVPDHQGGEEIMDRGIRWTIEISSSDREDSDLTVDDGSAPKERRGPMIER